MVSKTTLRSLYAVMGLLAVGVGQGCSSGEALPGNDDGGGAQGGGPTGGASTGGVATGGVATGGIATGGVATGGIATGGASGTGGGASGTTGLGGTATGGVSGAAGLAGASATGGTSGVGGAPGGAGSGGAPGCPTGQLACTNGCVDATSDPANCGACGTTCSGGRSCTAGMCACPTGQTFCNNACISTAADVNNCGGCGTRCTTGQTCSNGSCMGGTTTTGVIGWASVSGNGVTTTTGGSGGTTIDVNSASALSSNASSTARQIIRLTASVSVATLVVNSNKTIIGVGNNITISGGIELNNRNNVILQNIKLNARSTGVDGDGIRITNSHHVWIDHMEIWDAPDGNMDITDRSNFITVSWTKFWYSANPPDNNHRYSNLIGAGDAETGDEALLNVTWHHNWWADRVHERMPRVRFGDVHVFNNYYSSSGNNYCIRAGYHSNVLIENNHFQGVDTPHEAGEDQGTAIITARGNQYSSTTGAQQTRGTAFTPPYQYTLDAASSVGAAVQSGAGPH